MDTFSVVFYETVSGEKPAKVFLNELSDMQRAKTIRDLKILELYGNRLREPQSKYLEDGVYELRTKQGSNISRILYFFFVGKRIVIRMIILRGIHNMETLDQYLEKQLKNPKFKKEWDELEAEYQIIQNIVEARLAAHLTQMQLSELTGITQSDISKIENGNGNPSLKTLQKIARAFGKKLKIEFV